MLNPAAVQCRQCSFCEATFSRADAARRHAKRCSRRHGKELPHRKRGRPEKACRTCIRAKVHCDIQDGPQCRRCRSRQLDCSFVQLGRDPGPFEYYQRLHKDGLQPDVRHSLDFILNFLDDGLDYVTEREIAQEPSGAEILKPCSVPQDEFNGPISLLPDFDEAWASLLNFEDPESNNLWPHTQSAASPNCDSPSIWGRIYALESCLEWHVSLDATCGGFDSDAYHQLFTVTNVASFANLFCRKRHYQYPLIHWPTLVLEEAALPLLLAITLTGAAYSMKEESGESLVLVARRLHRVADSFIFHHLEACSEQAPSSPGCATSIEACQAALLMYGLDTMVKNDSELRSNAITKRMPILVSALRRLDFVNCKHDPLEDWETFIHREKIVRVVAWTYCADCLATLCFSKPPSFTVTEMTGDIPCDMGVWEADNLSSVAIRQLHPATTSHSLADLVTALLACDGSQHILLEEPSVIQVHMLICAFHQVLFNVQVSASLPGQSANLLTALNRWRQLWAIATGNLSLGARSWLGVAKHMLGLEHLARRIIEVAASHDSGCSLYIRRLPATNTRDLHAFLQDHVVLKHSSGLSVVAPTHS